MVAVPQEADTSRAALHSWGRAPEVPGSTVKAGPPKARDTPVSVVFQEPHRKDPWLT